MARGPVGALVGVLTRGDAAMVRRATDGVLGLPDLSGCADVDALPADAANSVVPRARAHLVLAELPATDDPESSSQHRAEARRALESSGALGAHLLAP